MNKATSKSGQDDEQGYFNIRVEAFGYLNEVRECESKEGDPFLACNLTALVGKRSEPAKRYLDCIVVGEKTQELVRSYAEDVEAGKTVFIHFIANDINPKPYTHKAGENKGKPDASMRSRLFHIVKIWIDGEEVYTAPSKEESAEEVSEPRQSAKTGNGRDKATPASTPDTKRGIGRRASRGPEKQSAGGYGRF